MTIDSRATALATLLQLGLLTPSQHDLALARPDPGASHDTPDPWALPADALVMMVRAGLISRGQLAALRAHIAASGTPAAAAILAQAGAELATHQRAKRGAFFGALLPGPRWLWFAGAPLLLAGAAWYVLRAGAAPACDARATRDTVDAMLLAATLSSDQRNAPPAPHIEQAREAGYNSARKTRGCLATLSYADGSGPYAFTIAPNGDRQAGGYVMAGAEPEMVAARFGHIGAGGDFANQAEPIGRDHAEQAFRAGMAELAGAGVKAELARLIGSIMPARRKSIFSNPAGGPEREVADVEPLAACRAVAPDTRYACPLLVEWNNPLLAALGRNTALMLRGEFTFERAAPGQPWHMSRRFSEELERAKSAAKDKADADMERERQEAEVNAGARP